MLQKDLLNMAYMSLKNEVTLIRDCLFNEKNFK